MNDKLESSDLETLLHQVKVRKYKEGSPKKILIDILDIIEGKKHYGNARNWELLVELLARWLVTNKEAEILALAGYPSCLPFHGLPLKTNLDLYQHIDKLDLFRYYYTAAKERVKLAPL